MGSATTSNFLSNVVGSPFLKTKLDKETPGGENNDHTDDISITAILCTGPATPEQVDTVSPQEPDAAQSRQELNAPALRPIPDRGMVQTVGSHKEPTGAIDSTSSLASTFRLMQESGDMPPAASTAPDSILPAPSDATTTNSTIAGVASGLDTYLATTSVTYADATPCDPQAGECTVTVASAEGASSATTAATTPPIQSIRDEVEPKTPTTPPRQPSDAPLLPPSTDLQRMTLVLDLDGTLIASEDEPHAPVPFDYCVDEERFVWLRPGLRRFLDSVRPQFEVVLFTAAGESWATSALQRIDPAGTIFDSRLYRDHTVSHDDWPWVKDLSRLGRDLARVVIVDDNPLMFMYQPDNALHVSAYDPQITGHSDDVLEQVLDVLLHKVLIADDVREVLRSMKEPITASCMAARIAAAKAAATTSLGTALRKAAISAPGAARTGAAAAATSASTVRGANGATESTADQAALAGGAQAKVGRRGRRSSKQPPQPQPQAASTTGAVQQGTATVAQPQPQPQAASTSAGAQQPLCDKKQRQPRSRRRGSGGSGGVEAPGDAFAAGPARAPAGQPAAVTLAAAASRPPVVASRARGQKHAAKRGAVQLATASPLQEPDQQLQLKLKLLQLQREQEEAEGSQAEEEDACAQDSPVLENLRLHDAQERTATVADPLRDGASMKPGVPALQASSDPHAPHAKGAASCDEVSQPQQQAPAHGLSLAKASGGPDCAKSRPLAATQVIKAAPCAAAGAGPGSGPAETMAHRIAGASSSATETDKAPSATAGVPHGAAVEVAAPVATAAVEGEPAGGIKRRARGRRRRRRRLADTPGGSDKGDKEVATALPSKPDVGGEDERHRMEAVCVRQAPHGHALVGPEVAEGLHRLA